jgi:hypothetical protein
MHDDVDRRAGDRWHETSGKDRSELGSRCDEDWRRHGMSIVARAAVRLPSSPEEAGECRGRSEAEHTADSRTYLRTAIPDSAQKQEQQKHNQHARQAGYVCEDPCAHRECSPVAGGNIHNAWFKENGGYNYYRPKSSLSRRLQCLHKGSLTLSIRMHY